MELEFKVFTDIHRGQASYHLSTSVGAHDVAASCSFEKHYQMSNCSKRFEHHGKESG